MILHIGKYDQLRSTEIYEPAGNFLYFHMGREFCIIYMDASAYTQLRMERLESEKGDLTRPKEPVM